MALREVKPLDQKQWNQVVEKINNGPTQEQREMMKVAMANAAKINANRMA